MNAGRTIFSQLMDFVPTHEFRRSVARYEGNRGVRRFTCWDQFLTMAFAQLTYRESLRDIEACPEPLRRVRYRDPETGKVYTFLTNDFTLPALTIAELYRARWGVELFFKWIKQHLRIKAFYGTSENAVKTQISIAISVYVLVAIARKQLGIERDLYTLLQILSVALFEKVPLQQALAASVYTPESGTSHNRLQLFDL